MPRLPLDHRDRPRHSCQIHHRPSHRPGARRERQQATVPGEDLQDQAARARETRERTSHQEGPGVPGDRLGSRRRAQCRDLLQHRGGRREREVLHRAQDRPGVLQEVLLGRRVRHPDSEFLPPKRTK